MNFKEQLELDVQNVFLNPGELGEKRMINDREITIIPDEELLEKRKTFVSRQSNSDGIYNGALIFYAAKVDFEDKPVIGGHMKVDSSRYIVDDVAEAGEMYLITLGRRGS